MRSSLTMPALPIKRLHDPHPAFRPPIERGKLGPGDVEPRPGLRPRHPDAGVALGHRNGVVVKALLANHALLALGHGWLRHPVISSIGAAPSYGMKSPSAISGVSSCS